MGIQLGSNFTLNTALPLDDRIQVADTTARDALPTGRRYEGLIVYVIADATNYQLVGGTTNSDWTELSGGGGGGGGGGANWQPRPGRGPVESYEYVEKVWEYDLQSSGFQELELWVKVPTSYRVGNPITLKGLFYSPSSSNNWAMVIVAYLIRKNTDAITSTTNSSVVISADVTNTVANMAREVTFVVSANGNINSIAVNPGDIIKLNLSRTPPSAGVNDTAAIRFIPSSTEVLFA